MSAKSHAKPPHDTPPAALREDGIEYGFIGRLQGLKYEYAFTAPTEPDEQQRIATCLSSLDALITAETQKNE